MDEVKYVLREEGDAILSLKDLQGLIWKRKKVIGAITILAFLLGLGISMVQPEYYVTRATLSSSVFSATEIEPHLNTITEYVSDHRFSELKTVFNIDQKQAESIRSIEFVNARTNGQLYTVEMVLDVTDTTIINDLQDQTISSLMDNPYLKRRFNLKREQYNTLLKASETELEALQEFKIETKDLGDKIQKGIVVYPLNIHSEILAVQEKKTHLQNKLDLLNIAEFVSVMETPSRPNGPSVWRNGLVSALIVMIITIAGFVGHYLLFSDE